MDIQTHHVQGIDIAEIRFSETLINDIEEGVDLVGTLYFQGIDKVVMYQNHFSEAFYDLSTRMTGEILQKFSNYRIRLAVVGEFKNVQSASLSAFIAESNRYGQIIFAESLEEALGFLSK